MHRDRKVLDSQHIQCHKKCVCVRVCVKQECINRMSLTTPAYNAGHFLSDTPKYNTANDSKLAAVARSPADDSVQNIALEQPETNIHVVCDDAELLLQEVLGVSSIYNYFSEEPRTWPGQ